MQVSFTIAQTRLSLSSRAKERIGLPKTAALPVNAFGQLFGALGTARFLVIPGDLPE